MKKNTVFADFIFYLSGVRYAFFSPSLALYLSVSFVSLLFIYVKLICTQCSVLCALVKSFTTGDSLASGLHNNNQCTSGAEM